MILTSKMFEDALEQINEAFRETNNRVTKLEEKLKALQEKEKTSAGKKTRPKAS